MMKPWWLSPEVFTSVLILLGVGVIGWLTVSRYIDELLSSWLFAL